MILRNISFTGGGSAIGHHWLQKEEDKNAQLTVIRKNNSSCHLTDQGMAGPFSFLKSSSLHGLYRFWRLTTCAGSLACYLLAVSP